MSRIITPLLTPFRRNGEVDYELMDALVEKIDSFHVDGIFPLGSTGVFPWLSYDERKRVLSIVREKTKTSIYAGIESSNIKEVIEYGKYARDLGCEYVVVTPPYYITPGPDEIGSFFRTALESIDLNVFIYNIPQFVGTSIPLQLVENLSRNFSNLAGVKDSSKDIRYFSRLISMPDRKIKVYQGQDDILLPSLVLGADGGVCGTSNISDAIVSVRDHFDNGGIKKASEIDINVINHFMDLLNSATFPSGYYYALYRSMGVDGGYRVPMIEPEDAVKKSIDRFLRDHELLPGNKR